jgi:hypothetical protein
LKEYMKSEEAFFICGLNTDIGSEMYVWMGFYFFGEAKAKQGTCHFSLQLS